MHVEFKKSILPKVQSIPPRFSQDSKSALCKKIMKLELENEDLREENFNLGCNLEKENATTPSSPPPKKEIEIHGYGHSPWQLPSLGECPGIVSPSHFYLHLFS